MVYFVMFDLLFSYCDGYNKCQTVKKHSQYSVYNNDKNKRFSFLSSIILDFFYDGMHPEYKQELTNLPLI
jgi:hypothetical protein